MLGQDHHISATAPAIRDREFLRIPPFPGAPVEEFARASSGKCNPEEILSAVRRERVGGTYWGAQPPLPAGRVVGRSAAAIQAARKANPDNQLVFWSDVGDASAISDAIDCGDADPWHVLEGAGSLYCEAGDPMAAVAKLLAVPVVVVGPDGAALPDPRTAADWIGDLFPTGFGFVCPFTGSSLTIVEAIELCGYWRRLIDSNRDITAGYGFAFWKKEAVAPLLWNGSAPLKFLSSAGEGPSGPVAVWRARTDPSTLDALAGAGTPIVEVEDGFLRSKGLGADCVPPLSIVVDRLGPHFDPAQASELENLLQNGAFDADMLRRAAELRAAIVKAGLGKYEAGGTPLSRFDGERLHVLVPGQVEDDQSVLKGGGGLQSNIELLRRVRAERQDACIIYKPHPDVLAGHRRGAASQQEALAYADHLVTDVAIAPLIDMVDEVQVNTSLTGFEALLRGKAVTTHGVPFYAGWGLTTDRGPVPARRSARRTLDELVAATLLIYPRYLDPLSGLPCPAEVAVQRLTATNVNQPDILVGLRRIQGRVMKRFRSMRR